MTCSPSKTAIPARKTTGREPLLEHAACLLTQHGGLAVEDLLGEAATDDRTAATATALMDLFRRTGDAEVFDCLVNLTTPTLLARVRSRLRHLGSQFDPHEVLQDTFVNIFRYPDRFAATRSAAFAAWSSAIVDNAIRRLLRRRQSGPKVALSPIEVLSQQADLQAREPDHEAVAHEETRAAASAFGILLTCYLHAFQSLSDRERFVLQLVEVRRMRYADVGQTLGIRAETIKMVVFRARKRVFERIGLALGSIAPLGKTGAAA